jgi:hypothetical protein
VDEDVCAALDRNEAEALLGVEPLHNTLRHVLSLNRIRRPHRAVTGPAWAFRCPRSKMRQRNERPALTFRGRENTYLEPRPPITVAGQFAQHHGSRGIRSWWICEVCPARSSARRESSFASRWPTCSPPTA